MMMIKRYGFFRFEKIADKAKTSVWRCVCNQHNAELGIVKWYGSWRQYIFIPNPNTEYSGGCLRDIADFLRQLNEEASAERDAVKKIVKGANDE